MARLAGCWSTSTAAAAQVLIDAGAQLQDPAADYVPLATAAAESRLGVVAALLAAGADVNAADGDGRTALHSAQSEECVRLLVSAGADMDAVDSDGRSPLHTAAEHGPLQLVQALLAAGASPHAVDSGGRTPMHIAAEGGAFDMVQALLATGGSPHALDHAGRTPMHAAAGCAGSGALETTQALLAAGASPHAVDKSGKTPLTAALSDPGSWYNVCGRLAAALLAAGTVPSTTDLTAALSNRHLIEGPWMLGLLPPSRSVSGVQLREWVGAAFSDPAARQALVWGTWALRGRLPPELLRLVAAMRCLLGG